MDKIFNLKVVKEDGVYVFLRVKIRSENGGYVVVELLYKNEVIDSDWMVDLDLNPLDE